MAERPGNLLSYRLTFVALVALVAFIQLLPINPGPRRIPGPDIILLIAFSWVIMRPHYVPVFLFAFVLLLADLLLMRPPGLWTALAVLAGEFLRGRHAQLRVTSFAVEWAVVAGLLAAMTVVNACILVIFSVEQPGLGAILIRLIFTILCYPLVVILAGRAFGIQKVSAMEQDRFG